MVQRYWKRLRGAVARCMIDDEYCMDFDAVMIRCVPKVVDNENGNYTCLLCGRVFDSFYSIFYHILVHHTFDVDMYVYEYLKYKYKLLGWIRDG